MGFLKGDPNNAAEGGRDPKRDPPSNQKYRLSGGSDTLRGFMAFWWMVPKRDPSFKGGTRGP